jgi:hypothetical protein
MSARGVREANDWQYPLVMVVSVSEQDEQSNRQNYPMWRLQATAKWD